MNRLLSTVFIVVLLLLEGCSAIESYKAEEEKSQRNAEAHVQLGVGYLKQGKLDVALSKLKKALSAEPNYWPAQSAIALVYQRMGEYENANDHYIEAISLAPENGGLYNNYGTFLCSQGEYQEAEEYFLKAIAVPRYETPELAYENAGSCVRKTSNPQKAEEYLTKALNKNDKLPVALINMAQIRFEQASFLSSRGFLQRYEAVARHNAESLWLGVLVERKLGDKKAEMGYAKQLQTNFPKSEQFKLLLNSQGENQS